MPRVGQHGRQDVVTAAASSVSVTSTARSTKATTRQRSARRCMAWASRRVNAVTGRTDSDTSAMTAPGRGRAVASHHMSWNGMPSVRWLARMVRRMSSRPRGRIPWAAVAEPLASAEAPRDTPDPLRRGSCAATVQLVVFGPFSGPAVNSRASASAPTNASTALRQPVQLGRGEWFGAVGIGVDACSGRRRRATRGSIPGRPRTTIRHHRSSTSAEVTDGGAAARSTSTV